MSNMCLNGCDVTAKARGLCKNCYQKAMRKRNINPLPPLAQHWLSNVDLDNNIADCCICGLSSIIEKYKNGKTGQYIARCKKVVVRNRLNQIDFRKNHGLNGNERLALIAIQNNKCKLCDKFIEGKDANVDHDHFTGTVRGALCTSCNVTLGRVEQNPDYLDKILDYVKNTIAPIQPNSAAYHKRISSVPVATVLVDKNGKLAK